MHKTAFIFPGQGSQSIGMMAALAERNDEVMKTFIVASQVLDYDLWRVCQEGPEEELNRTEVTQPAVLAAGIASWRAWKSQNGPDPDYLAGHSLGEYSALVASGSLAFEDAIALVAERGRLMQAAVEDGAGAMAAVLGLEDELLAQVCVEAEQGQVVSCANFNSPGQVVIAGDKAAVERACTAAVAAGARRAIPLAVSVPSHCALMKPAADQLAAVLQGVTIERGNIPVIHNVDVKRHQSAEGIRNALVKQLSQPVQWAATILAMIELGVNEFVECGPGKVLTGLNRRIAKEVSTVALVRQSDLDDALKNWSE